MGSTRMPFIATGACSSAKQIGRDELFAFIIPRNLLIISSLGLFSNHSRYSASLPALMRVHHPTASSSL